MCDTCDRGYGWTHQKVRAYLLPRSYGKPCHFCGQLMLPGQKLDLDHNENKTGYRGMAHRRCNRQDGARKTNEARARKAHRRNPSRDWTSRDW